MNGADVAPSVLLSVVMVWIGVCVQIAFAEGCCVWWWRVATAVDVAATAAGADAESSRSNHADARRLHREWLVSGSLVEAVRCLWPGRFTPLGPCTILVAALGAAGPLWQKSVGVRTDLFHFNGRVLMKGVGLGMVIPLYYPTAVFDEGKGLEGIMAYDYATSVSGLIGSPLVYVVAGEGCQGTCFANMTGAGFTTQCEEMEIPFDLESGDASANSTEVMLLGASFSLTSANTIEVSAVSKTSSSCSGVLVRKTCTLTAAAVTHSVAIQADPVEQHLTNTWNITLAEKPRYEAQYVAREAVHETIYPDTNNGTSEYSSALGGIYLSLLNYFNFNFSGSVTNGSYIAKLQGDPTKIISLFPTTGVGHLDFIMYNDPTTFYANANNCTITFQDANGLMDKILQAANDLFFATAARSAFLSQQLFSSVVPMYPFPDEATNALNLKYNQTVSGDEYAVVQLYTTDLGYLIAGVVVVILSTMACAVLYWRFWILDKRRTLSPVETARLERLREKSDEKDGEVVDGYRIVPGVTVGSGGWN